MKKKQQIDAFSFKAPSSRNESLQTIQIHEIEERRIKPEDIRYRHLQNKFQKPPLKVIFGKQISDHISNLDQEIEENVKKRIQLEQKMKKQQTHKKIQAEKQMTKVYYNDYNYRSQKQQVKQFKRSKQQQQKLEQHFLEKNNHQRLPRKKQILLSSQQTDKYQEPIPQITSFINTFTPQPLKIETNPPQIKIQKLLQKVTFPQIPKANLKQICKQIETLYACHSAHSDIYYLLMIIYFHLDKYKKVKEVFLQIINFKSFNKKAYWVSAQAEFALQNYEECLNRTEDSLNCLEDCFLPRFLFLKAKSYEKIGNFLSSVICYSNLIKIKGKTSEYYLSRGLIYHRIGYYKEAKEDFLMFGILQPQGKQHLMDKILVENNDYKKKEYLAVLAKMY